MTGPLLSDVDHSNEDASLTGDGKTVTLDLNGKTIKGGWISAGDPNQYTACTLKIIGSGSFIHTGTAGNLGVYPGGTLDLSGWTGGTITRVELADNANAAEALRKQTSLIVGRNAGTIDMLWLGNWQLSPEDTAKVVNLSGGSYNTIQISGWNSNLISLGDLLASGYAFRYTKGDQYVEYAKKLTTEQDSMGDIKDLTVVPCPHTSITNGTCDYCNKTGIVAAVNDKLYENFAAAQSAWLADGGTLKLYRTSAA